MLQQGRIDAFDGLVRQFGAVRVSFALDAKLYPGAQGACESGRTLFGWRLYFNGPGN